MHEFGITERLLQVALTQAGLKDGERIRRLQINLDPDSGYAPDSIRFYFEQLAQDTPAAGAELDFQWAPEPYHIALNQMEIDEAPPVISQSPAGGQPGFEPPADSGARWRMQIRGVVQGVGFRPFVHNLAQQLGLSGWVRNTAGGVELELQGPLKELEHFRYHLQHDAPPLAHILAVETTACSWLENQPPGLEIHPSHSEAGRTLISPDVATCACCLTEIFDSLDRRYHYPFTTCTHCGPRFTIITDLPYDRPRTTMAGFPLCPDCTSEYKNPANRRFHTQPVACSVCGPMLWYARSEETPALTFDTPIEEAALAEARRCLAQGGIVAVKGLGGFHLACRADDSATVRRLRASKNRPAKPLAVMVRSLAEAAEFCLVSPAEQALLLAPEAPIVLLRKRNEPEAGKLAPEIAPQNGYIGLMLPYTPLHHLLLQATAGPLVMTSGNNQGEPLCIDNAEAGVELRPYCDGFLMHNRPIAHRCDDSVMLVANLNGSASPQLVRRSRGLVPLPVPLPAAVALSAPLVASGADLKNVPALAFEDYVFLTQHIGDLSNLRTRQEHARMIAEFERLFRLQPQAIVCDLHPDYASSRYAHQRANQEGLPLLEVQHHHAHIAGCLAENNHLGQAIGLSFDGTGYGSDGHIWGGEVLLADLHDFRRLYHLEYLPLPGGEAAIRHPDRIALAYLRTLLPDVPPATWLPDAPACELATLETMLAQGLNTPLTSSMGRLFDAVSALLGLCREATYEAEAAIALEAAALSSDFAGSGYDFHLAGGQIRLASLLAQLMADRQSGLPTPDIARRFHQTVAEMAVAAAKAAAIDSQTAGDGVINTVALSGGVWQNRLLLELTVPLLRQADFEVLLPRAVPANDGGLAYGQVAVAAARLGGQGL